MFLEECKYDVKEKETSKFITDDVEISSYGSQKEDSDDKNWWGKLNIEIFLEKYRNFFNLGTRNFHSGNIRNFYFFELCRFSPEM